MKNLIGIAGKKGSGKTTVGQYINDAYGFGKFSFASPMKVVLDQLLLAIEGPDALDKKYNWDDEEWKSTVIPEVGVTPRVLAQTFGTDWGRDTINKDIWINILARGISIYEEVQLEMNQPVHGSVVTDVRFQNEAKWIRQNGGQVWHIDRGSINAEDPHASEEGIRENMIDRVIPNNTTFERLGARIDELMAEKHIEKVQGVISCPS